MTDHWGDPFREQRALASGEGAVVLAGHGIVRLTGRDRLVWLDSLLSQDLRQLAAGESTEALLLDPNGHIERVARILDDGTATWLLVDEDAVGFAQWLESMTFRRDVSVMDVSANYVGVGFMSGGHAESVISDITAVVGATPLVWRDSWAEICPGGWQYAATVGHPAEGWNYCEAIMASDSVAEIRNRASQGEIVFAGTLAIRALRIAAWRPAFADVDSKSLPHEFDWLRSAVHLSKGCYRGQETVAKVHNLGHPPRRLVFLDLDGSAGGVPEPGDVVAFSHQVDRVVGHVTSAARHFEEGPIALALVKRSLPEDAKLIVRSSGGAVVSAHSRVIVPIDAGKTLEVPRITRGRDRPSRL